VRSISHDSRVRELTQDIKADNVLISSEGEDKGRGILLGDFNLASTAPLTATAPPSAVHTPLFFSDMVALSLFFLRDRRGTSRHSTFALRLT
jgi:serine/threonine protein kinase